MSDILTMCLYRKRSDMQFPLPADEPSATETPPTTPSPTPISNGSGIAITGVCVASFLLVAFLLTLNYTDLLVVNSANRAAAADNPNAFIGEMFLLAVTFSPMIFSYRVCAKIIDKA